MSSEYFIKGFPLSSTPVPSQTDSGYFGSTERRLCGSNAKNLSNYSPIKEYSYKNRTKNSHFEDDSGVDSDECRVNLLDYINLTIYELSSDIKLQNLSKQEFRSNCSKTQHNRIISSDLQDYLSTSEQYTHNSSCKGDSCCNCLTDSDSIIEFKIPPVHQSKEFIFSTECDFKYKKKNSSLTSPEAKNFKSLNVQEHVRKSIKVNFIHELKKINCSSIISCILAYLSDEELCKASCVSKEWNEAIREDKKASFRKENLIREKTLLLNGPFKENRLGMKFGPPREHKVAFSDLTNKVSSINSSNLKTPKSRFDSFLKEVKNGHSRLQKCPKCCYASTHVSENNCMCTHCSYRFCSHCLGPIFNFHTCYTNSKEIPNISIGSKKSKRNLKRL